MIKKILYILIFCSLFLSSCRSGDHDNDPAPADMQANELYTCPMHPEIVRNAPGSCPICNMTLVKKESGSEKISDDTLDFILKPANQQVLMKINVVKPETKKIAAEFSYQGIVSYIPQDVGTIAARLTGRIEKIYVKYNYQQVSAGQKLFEIYSPEILTEQNNLLFLLKDDAENTSMIEGARNKLKLLGVSAADLATIERTGKPLNAIPVYSSYDGFITNTTENAAAGGMNSPAASQSAGLMIKEGSYIQKGQTVLKIINRNKLWALISIPVSDMAYVKAGNKVRIQAEANPENDFRAEINYVEPALDETKKQANARVIFDNTKYNLPIGSQLKAVVFGDSIAGTWLPGSAVIRLGAQNAVLLKTGIGFKIKYILISSEINGKVKIISGLSEHDEVAANAQYIMDSESFVKE